QTFSAVSPFLVSTVCRCARSSRATERLALGLRQALEKVTQQLIAADAVVAMPGLAKQCTEFRLGDREPGVLENRQHVLLLQLEGHTQLLQNQVVGQGQLDGWRRPAFILAALV